MIELRQRKSVFALFVIVCLLVATVLPNVALADNEDNFDEDEVETSGGLAEFTNIKTTDASGETVNKNEYDNIEDVWVAGYGGTPDSEYEIWLRVSFTDEKSPLAEGSDSITTDSGGGFHINLVDFVGDFEIDRQKVYKVEMSITGSFKGSDSKSDNFKLAKGGNDQDPEDSQGTLTIVKELLDSEGEAINDEIEFNILVSGPNGYEYSGTITSNDATPLVLTGLAEGEYSVEELEGTDYDLEDYTVDDSEKAYIGPNGWDGTITVTNQEKDNGGDNGGPGDPGDNGDLGDNGDPGDNGGPVDPVEADLTITKIVQRGDKDREFEFTLWIDGKLYIGEYEIGGDTFVTNDGTLKLSHGKTAVIKDLEVDTEYRVTEANYSSYRTTSVGEEGVIEEDGSSATFTNTRKSGGGGGGGNNDNDNDREDDNGNDGDENEPIEVPEDPAPQGPGPGLDINQPETSQPEGIEVPGDPEVAAPAAPKDSAAPVNLPKTGAYPAAAAALGTMLLGLGVYLKRR